MEKSKLLKFHSQLSNIYVLAIIHIILSVIGLLLNYFCLKSDYLLFSIIGLNILALISFEPWKISKYLNEGYGYFQSIESISKNKGDKNV